MTSRRTGPAGCVARALLGLALLLLPVRACGPWFPNTLLYGGDETLLEAPIVRFHRELDRIKVAPVSFRAVRAPQGRAGQTFASELSELRAALVRRHCSEREQERILAKFQQARQALQQHAKAVEDWQERQAFRDSDEAPTPGPGFTAISIPDDLPAEFADYLSGTVAYYSGDLAQARQHWERLLARPRAERQYRSTWAAYMLGRSGMADDPEKALMLFQQVRTLAKDGFADAVGLAAASYGWQAKLEFQRANYADAIRLYLLQHQTGDETAAASLRMISGKIFAMDHSVLHQLATDSTAQQVLTAYLMSRHYPLGGVSANATEELIGSWLDAVEQGGAIEIEAADRLALAAYRRGLFEQAASWLKRAKPSAMAQWLRAKLLLRSGNVSEATKLLAQVTRLFSREGEWPDPPLRDTDNPSQSSEWDEDSPIRQAAGELGVLQLSRREYYQALDTLLRAGFWTDAAYVAENVLAPDELMAYVDRHWPEPEEDSPLKLSEDKDAEASGGLVSLAATTTQIRYLVARRLARLQRWQEAFDFYPQKWRARFREFVQDITDGRDPSASAADRALALWNAAHTARYEGMELFGTELEPDWHVHDGQYDPGHLTRLRTTDPKEPRDDSHRTAERSTLSGSSPDERRRIGEHRSKPDHRFHYRYIAADLAWEGAQLMPNDGDDTARLLWQAGTWLKARDPVAADRFYKALVRRCRHTALGQAADQLRWFPLTDTPVLNPPAPVPADEAPVEAEPDQGSAPPEARSSGL